MIARVLPCKNYRIISRKENYGMAKNKTVHPDSKRHQEEMLRTGKGKLWKGFETYICQSV
jgi:hypothetical protein